QHPDPQRHCHDSGQGDRVLQAHDVAPQSDVAELKKWGTNFAKVGQDTPYDLLLAANYLNVKDLLDLIYQTVADLIKVKTTEEIRNYFNIKNDFTLEEEEKIRRENQWAFE
ncbi:unnamed protein product, partial [Linum tenue]